MGKEHPKPVKKDAAPCDGQGQNVGAFTERRFIKNHNLSHSRWAPEQVDLCTSEPATSPCKLSGVIVSKEPILQQTLGISQLTKRGDLRVTSGYSIDGD